MGLGNAGRKGEAAAAKWAARGPTLRWPPRSAAQGPAGASEHDHTQASGPTGHCQGCRVELRVLFWP